MTNRIRNISLILGLFSLAAFQQLNAQEERSLPDFDAVSVMGNIEVYLEKGESEKAVIYTYDIEEDKLNVFVRNNTLKLQLINPSTYNGRGAKVYITYRQLRGIKAHAGARVISEETGFKLESATMQDLGKAKRVVIDKDNTTIVEGAGKSADIKARIAQIRKQIENTTSEYDREKLQERLAKLAGGVAVLKIGAATEIEMKEKKARVEDALHATRAAVEEGIVPGGGVALLRTLKALGKMKLEGDQQIGVNIMIRALEEPIRQIVHNSGLEGAVIVQKVKEGSTNFGFNAYTEKFEDDMVKSGIIDPTKVTRTAVENASSVAGLLLMTEAVISEIPEKEEPMPGGGAPGMGGMGGMGGMY